MVEVSGDHLYRVTARNPARSSENRVHDDEEARRLGFEGGLVPGITVYAYCSGALLDRLTPEDGERWLSGGYCKIRFVAPCYDGDEVVVAVGPPGAGGELPIEASVKGRVRAVGTGCVAGGPALSGGPITGSEIPSAELPQRRVPASVDSLAPGRVLGSVDMVVDDSDLEGYLASVDESSPVYAERGWVHPGLLMQGANSVLMANVTMPLWLHTESEVRHLRPVAVGERIEVRGRVADNFERKGHPFVVVDVAWVGADGMAAAVARHTAIWRYERRTG